MNHRMKIALAIGCAVSSCATATAATVSNGVLLDNYFFPDTVVVQGQKVLLNGAVSASTMGVKTIDIGLYVTRRQKTMEGILAEKGAKRVNFFFVRDASSRDTTNALLDRLRQNISREEFGANILAISQLGGTFGSRKRFNRGDEVSIDYSSETQSTEFLLNHVKFGDTIQGEAFYSMLLKVFIGPNIRERDGLLLGAEP